MLKLSLQQQYFDAIKSGHKTVEGRLNKEKYQKLVVGENIQFESPSNDKLICVIVGITTYSDFTAMLLAEGIQNMLPGVATVQEGVKIYESFPGYKQEVQKVGALALKIRCIKPE